MAALPPSMGFDDEQAIRVRIRAELASGRLKSRDGMLVNGRMGIKQFCAACAKPIGSEKAASVGHAYADGARHWFHARCLVLWEEERKPQ